MRILALLICLATIPASAQVPVLRQDGHTYRLGCLPPTPKAMASIKATWPRLKPLPRSEWHPVDWSWAVVNVDDQDGLGSCASNASTGALEVCRVMSGLGRIPLSAGQLYGQITTRDAGSSLGDNLAVLALEGGKGVCPTSLVPPLDWSRSKWPIRWEETAASFRVVKAVLTDGDFDMVATALQLGQPSVIALYVGNHFRVGADGWLEEYTGGSGGHAMLAVGLVQKDGRWGLLVLNSWGRDWGKDGMCVVPESYLRSTPFTDSWSVQLTVTSKAETVWGLSP